MSPNAFATGRNPSHAAVAATEGILRLLSESELEGVIAHELAHVRNRDILISSIAATIGAAIMMLAHMAQWGAMFAGVRLRTAMGAKPGPTHFKSFPGSDKWIGLEKAWFRRPSFSNRL